MSILGPFKSVAMNKHFVRNNLVDRDKELRRRVNAGFLHNTTVSQLSEMTDDMGILIKGMIISPASTATDLEPTSTGFSGTVLTGDGVTIGDTLYSLADILAGVVQVGIIPGGGFVLGAGAWVGSATGVLITGVQFIEQHTATVGAYDRRMRRGFQEVSSKPAYLLEYFDDAVGTNLITTNSDFETGSLATGFSASTNWAIISTGQHGGSYAAAIAQDKTNPLTTNKYAVTAGNSYTASYWADQDAAGGTFTGQVLWYNAVPTLLQTDTVHSGSNKYGYFQRSGTFVAPVGATQCEIKLYFSVAGGAAFYAQVDDISLVLVSQYAALRLSDSGIDLVDETGFMRYSAGAITLPESAAPSTPAAGYGAIFQSTIGRLSAISDTALVGPLVVAVAATINAENTSGTGETILATYTIPAGVLESNVQGVRLWAFAEFTTGAATKTLRIRFGGIGGTIITSEANTAANMYEVRAFVWRTGAATQGAYGSGVRGTAPTQTLANAVDIVLTGQTTTAAQTVYNPILIVEFLPMVNQV